MGRFLVILLVMLMPLRGWSAESMALQMALSPLTADVAGQQVSMDAMPADCPMLAQQASETDKSPRPAKRHSGCLTCQLCMSLATQDLAAPDLLTYERQVPTVSVAVSFISAELVRQAKPPIL